MRLGCLVPKLDRQIKQRTLKGRCYIASGSRLLILYSTLHFAQASHTAEIPHHSSIPYLTILATVPLFLLDPPYNPTPLNYLAHPSHHENGTSGVDECALIAAPDSSLAWGKNSDDTPGSTSTWMV